VTEQLPHVDRKPLSQRCRLDLSCVQLAQDFDWNQIAPRCAFSWALGTNLLSRLAVQRTTSLLGDWGEQS
jgi:hypothetical protein